MKLRAFIFCLAAVQIFAAPSAHASLLLGSGVTYFWSAGRYAEMEVAAREQILRAGKQTTTYVAPLCLALGKLKRYNQLFECVGRLDVLVRAGDVTLTHPDAPWGPMSSDITPLPGVLRAEAYLELGEYERSRAEAERALAAITDRNDMGLLNPTSYRIDLHAVLAIGAVLEGDRRSAEAHLAILEKIGIPFTGAMIYRNLKRNALGRVYMALGHYDKALAQLKEEHYKFAEAVGNLFLREGDTLGSLYDLDKVFMVAKCLAETGRDEEAGKMLDGLLANPRIRDQGGILWPALHERGYIAERTGNADEAIGYYRRAVEVIEQQRSTLNTEASKIGFVGDKQAVYRRLIAALVRAQRHAEAFDYLERSKSRALVDMLASKKDFMVREGDPARLNELLAKTERAEMEAPAQGGAQEGAPSSTEASGQRSLAVSPAQQAAAEMPSEIASLVSVSSTPIEEIQARIPEDEVLVEYYYDDKSLFVFMLSRQGLQVAQTGIGSLETDARALRDAVATPKSEAWLPIAQRLYRQLLGQIEPLLAGRTKLIVVPQGVLHYVPFAALHDGERFLLDKYAFRLLPSASVVKYLREQPSHKPGGILAFGNPDLGDPKYDLRFAEEEARAIVRTVPQSRAVLRKEATEAALRDNAAGYNYLHFATHGEFNADAPLNSALLLAKDATGDGLLTVGKLYSMRLDIDLATLSACETGLGKIANGDDVVGLTRGFLYAGASTIVASLWQVDDRATSDLMTKFYGNLEHGDKREALRQAQLDARNRYAHPYYWAAFQLTGNAR
jgi:CHAT domain-containing protein